VATIGMQVAEALEHAHKQGIHHRDIKPSNLLLDSQGTVWVTDFGLAKADDQQNLTRTGDILGTLRYMPPEAFEGKTDARSDVYSLGLTLYEMLAFRSAFDEKERNRLIKQVTETDPVRLGKLNRHVPRDLQTIVHKAIDKDPARRYASAGALAEDLQRFVDDEPIRARRMSQAERLWRWSRRHKAIAALLALLGTVLTVGFVVMAMLWSRAEDNATFARSKERDAQTLATKEAKAREEAQEQERIALEQKQIALEKAELIAREDYVNRVNRAYREVQDDNIALAENLLHGCDPKRRGWEWHYVERLCNSERRVIDLGNSSVNALAYSPDGTWAVSGSGDPPFETSGAVTSLDIWDVSSGRRLKTLPHAKGTVYAVAASPDGKRVAAGFGNGLVMVWDVATGQSVWTRNDPGLNAMGVAFSPDGKSLAVGYGWYNNGDQVGRVKVWQAESGKEIKTFAGPRGGVNKVAYHPDGKRLAVAGAEVVQVWDVEGARKVQDLGGHKKWVYALAYSPDGKWLATGGWDNTVKLRNASTGLESLTIFAHEGYVLDVAFSPDSRNLVTTSEDRSVRIWEVPSGRRVATFHGHTDFVQAVAFRPNGREIGTGSVDGSIRLWDLRTSRSSAVEHTGWVTRIRFRSDGLRVLTEATHFDGTTTPEPTRGWNPITGELDLSLSGINMDNLPARFVASTRFTSDWISRSTKSSDAKLIAQTGGDLGGTGGPMRSKDLSFSSVVVRESQTGKILHTLTGHSADVVAMAFSPDRRRLATASFDRTVKLWDMQTGQEVFTLLGHTAGVVSLAFSPDGNQIVSGGIDCTARVWNATPLPSNMTAEHDTRYRKKIETLTQLKAATDVRERAKILAGAGQWGMAAAAFAEALAKDPDDLQLRYQHIDALVKIGNTSAVEAARNAMLTWFEAKFAKNPEDVKSARSLAQLLLDKQEKDNTPKWMVLKPSEVKSQGGATLTKLDDDSILASGTIPAEETYTFVGRTALPKINAIRLDAIADESLPNRGPGRTEGGNFRLGDVRVTIDRGPSGGGTAAVTLKNAVADSSEIGYPASNAIDGDPNSSWSIWPEGGKSHTACFELGTPLETALDTRLQISLHSDSFWKRVTLGRFRLSVTGDDGAYEAAQLRFAAGNLADPLAKLAGAYALNGRRDEALQYFSRALKRADGYEARKVIFEFAVRFDELVPPLMTHQADDPQLQLALARIFAERGRKHLAAKQAANAQAELQKSREIIMRLRANQRQSRWSVLAPTKMTSDGGATLTRQGDGSILTSGHKPDRDLYTLVSPAPLRRITAIRLEALIDPTLPRNGPGNSENGNFHLGDFRVVIDQGESGGSSEVVILKNAVADFSQWCFPISNAIDGNPRSPWGIMGEVGKPHSAFFELGTPLETTLDMRLRISLHFADPMWKQHTLGRFRLSVTDDAEAMKGAALRVDLEALRMDELH
jgi:WD40 repeat protein